MKLLGTLPLDPQVVTNGDIGDMGLLEQPDLPVTRESNKIVDAVILESEARAAADLEAQKKVPARKKTSPGAKIIVVPVSGGKLSSHFGHCEQFAFIETRGREIVATEMLTPPPAHEPGGLPRWLHDQGADVVVVGGMGEKAQGLLRENGIYRVLRQLIVRQRQSRVRKYVSPRSNQPHGSATLRSRMGETTAARDILFCCFIGFLESIRALG